jgi:hypothetical protein
MKFWVLFQPVADNFRFEILSVIEKKNDFWSMSVTYCSLNILEVWLIPLYHCKL